MEAGNWIALGVGGYAAIVASAALIWNIFRERRRVKVKLEFNWTPNDPSLETGEIEQIGFTVINDSRYPTYLESAGVIFSDGEAFTIHSSVFAVDRCIQPGMHATYWMESEYFKKYIKGKSAKFGYVKDATLKIYKKRIPRSIAREIALKTYPPPE